MTPRSKPSSCIGCPLQSHGTDFTQIEGTGALGVLLCGEASGENEARDQLPFRSYARAGQILERTLRRLGLSRQQFSLTNACRCRPRNNFLDGAPWEQSALAHCQPNLEAAIARFRPKVVVALGGVALRALTGLAGESRGVSNLRGYVLPSHRYTTSGPAEFDVCEFCEGKGCKVNPCGGKSQRYYAKSAQPLLILPTYHPAFIGRGAQHLMGVFARDILRAVAVAQGKDTEFILDPLATAALNYQVHPSLEDVLHFLRMAKANPVQPISFDLETYESTSLDEDARSGFQDTHIRLIQFSIKPGTGIAFPWTDPFRQIAAQILALPNPKLGHNINHFDLKVLRAAGEREGLQLWPKGDLYDTMDIFRTWQPDLPANLQFAASFANFPFPWKHLSGSNLEFYGCADVDAPLRLAAAAQRAMRGTSHPITHLSLWDAYERSVYAVRPVLRKMEDRGIPVDNVERVRLGEEFDVAQGELEGLLDGRCPESVKSVSPKEGYKKTPKDTTGMIQREFPSAVLTFEGEPTVLTVPRWCRLEPFSPNSSQQLLRYMKAKGHTAPKDAKKQSGETTAAKELVRLADKTGDDFYLKVIECREFGKMKGTYVDGYIPASDGRIHTSITFDTATWQLAAKNPNVVNIPKHGRLAKPIRRMFQAPDGYEFSEWDFKSYHVLTTGFNAESREYCRLARLDMHSFVANEFCRSQGQKGLKSADQLFILPDEELLAYLKWFKSDPIRKRVRDKQAKPCILGIGFGQGERTTFLRNREYFRGLLEVHSFMETFRGLFPEVFAWQDRVKQLAHHQTFLQSRFGAIRWFYEVFVWDNQKGRWVGGEQAEQAVAFLPANEAFGNIRECLKTLDSSGAAERWGLCNNVHDSCVFLYPRSQRDQHLAEVYPILTAPSKILTHPVLAPGGLVVDVECACGPSLAEMEEVSMGPGVLA